MNYVFNFSLKILVYYRSTKSKIPKLIMVTRKVSTVLLHTCIGIYLTWYNVKAWFPTVSYSHIGSVQGLKIMSTVDNLYNMTLC